MLQKPLKIRRSHGVLNLKLVSYLALLSYLDLRSKFIRIFDPLGGSVAPKIRRTAGGAQAC